MPLDVFVRPVNVPSVGQDEFMGSRGAQGDILTVKSDGGERRCGCESCGEDESYSYGRQEHLFERMGRFKDDRGEKVTVYKATAPSRPVRKNVRMMSPEGGGVRAS